MKIFITGGTGLIGTALITSLLKKGHQVVVHTRNVEKASGKFGNDVSYSSSLDVSDSLDGYDAVINLAGESIAGGRWTEKRKDALSNSRLRMTQKLAALIKNSQNPPKVFISGSAIGYYGAQGDNVITEESGFHDEFTHRLCKQWEAYAMEAQRSDTRVCILRTGIVLSSQGGMLSKMAPPFKMGLGSVLGKGNQYISWIHIDDMVRAIIFLLENTEVQGVFNMTSPNPVTNKEFSYALARSLNRPCFFKIPALLISAAMGEASTLLLDGQRAIPKRLEEIGYTFSFPNIDEALKNIFAK